jgi:hypothetical protein
MSTASTDPHRALDNVCWQPYSKAGGAAPSGAYAIRKNFSALPAICCCSISRPNSFQIGQLGDDAARLEGLQGVEGGSQ